MAGKKTGAKKTSSSEGGRKLVAQAFVSLDGVMQAPGGQEEDREGGFRHGGWTMTYWDDVMGRVMGEEMAQPHELLLGRKTYDIFAAYWPNHRDQPGAESLNAATKYVASRTLKRVDWENSTLLKGDVAAAIRELKTRPGPPIQVLGSANLLQTLLKHDLVDEVSLWVFPVAVGPGKRFFDAGTLPTAWKLSKTQASTTGVLIQRYVRDGAIRYGSPPGT